jgi:putative ABC transport system substrate-binding protein
MSRRAFLTGLGATLAVPLAARAQQAKTVYTVSTLSAAPRNGSEHLLHALESELGRLGYAEGRNIAFEYRFANGKLERLPELAAA